MGKADTEEVGVYLGGAKYFIALSIAHCDWVVYAVNAGDKPMGHWLLVVPAWWSLAKKKNIYIYIKQKSVGPFSASAHREIARYARLPVQPWLRAFMLCLVLCGTQLMYFIGCVLSCLVWTRGLWVFSLAACSCPVLHMAGDLFWWPCACVFVLCEHMAFVFVLCVPCALMSIVLTPPNLLPDYWLICPTCVYLVTLLVRHLCYRWVYPVPALPCQLPCFSPSG